MHSSGPTTRIGTVDARELLLQAALRVYSTSGVRGATTRRIAQEAGVNEVTLFRHFGSKDALIQEALAFAAEQFLAETSLPAVPVDPEAELLEFSRQYLAALSKSRSLIRTCLGEFDENPEATRIACRTPIRISEELEVYLTRLRAIGLARGPWNERAAAAMLMGTLFADAMGRDCMPQRYPFGESDAVGHYVSLFLCAIGASRCDSSIASPSPVQE